MFQSTHPHGVRQKVRTHTVRSSGFNPRTHTGCDKPYTIFASFHHSFNPRTHTGCDLLHQIKETLYYVSIHAPTRGATYSRKDKAVRALFQSTHPHGVRHLQYKILIFYIMFQSTHPHGVRQLFPLTKIFTFMFQSTHPHGVRRERWFSVHDGITVSIHAPTRGATLMCTKFFNRKVVSIHAPTRGATTKVCKGMVNLRVSIHAPTRGAT